MAYSKQTWADDAAGGTPLSAARLNYIETGIEGVANEADTHASRHFAGGPDSIVGNLDAVAKNGVQKAGLLIGERRAVNLIEGSNVTIAAVDNAGSERVDVTIAATGGAGGTAGNDVVYVTDTWGADATGATDSSTAWANALAALPSTGGTVVCQKGATYKANIVIPKDNVIIQGNGATIVRNSTGIVLDVSGAHASTTTTATRRRFKCYDLILDGNGSAGGSAPVLRCWYSAEHSFYNLRITNHAGPGIHGVEFADSNFYSHRNVNNVGDGNVSPCILLESWNTVGRTRLTAAFVAGSSVTATVNSTTGFNPSGSFILDNGISGISVNYTGKTSTTFTGCTTTGTGSFNTGEPVWGPYLGTGFGHSTDICSNIWFYGAHFEGYKDGGVVVRGFSTTRRIDSVMFFGAKFLCRNVSNQGCAVLFAQTSNSHLYSANTSIGEFDTGETIAIDHIRLQNADSTLINACYFEALGVAAASTRTYISLNGTSDTTLQHMKFAGSNTGGSVNPTTAAIEYTGSNTNIDRSGIGYVLNPASVALATTYPTSTIEASDVRPLDANLGQVTGTQTVDCQQLFDVSVRLTLSGNTILNLTNVPALGRISIRCQQGLSGGPFTLTIQQDGVTSTIRYDAGTPHVMTTTAGAIDRLVGEKAGANIEFNTVGKAYA